MSEREREREKKNIYIYIDVERKYIYIERDVERKLSEREREIDAQLVRHQTSLQVDDSCMSASMSKLPYIRSPQNLRQEGFAELKGRIEGAAQRMLKGGGGKTSRQVRKIPTPITTKRALAPPPKEKNPYTSPLPNISTLAILISPENPPKSPKMGSPK